MIFIICSLLFFTLQICLSSTARLPPTFYDCTFFILVLFINTSTLQERKLQVLSTLSLVNSSTSLTPSFPQNFPVICTFSCPSCSTLCQETSVVFSTVLLPAWMRLGSLSGQSPLSAVSLSNASRPVLFFLFFSPFHLFAYF